MFAKAEPLLLALGVGVYSASALGCVNVAAHKTEWAVRLMYAAFGAYMACSAVLLAGKRKVVAGAGGAGVSAVVLFGSFLPFAAVAEGRVVWAGGAWIAAAGALVALFASLSLGAHFALAPANRGTVARGPYRAVRHPMAAAFVVICAGFLLVRFHPWNAGILGAAAVFMLVAAFLEERVLCGTEEYRAYAGRVRWRFVPGIV